MADGEGIRIRTTPTKWMGSIIIHATEGRQNSKRVGAARKRCTNKRQWKTFCHDHHLARIPIERHENRKIVRYNVKCKSLVMGESYM